jgi:Ca-activated chloride channel family protein
MEGSAIMDEIAGVSGGKAFFPNSTAEMDEDFERIALELRHQYSIGYRSRKFTADGRWHRVKVRVTPPAEYSRLLVQSREGYHALPGTR